MTFTILVGSNIAIRDTVYCNIEKQLIGNLCSVLRLCSGLESAYGIITTAVPPSKNKCKDFFFFQRSAGVRILISLIYNPVSRRKKGTI